jgi:hypothetical protein
VRRLLAGPDWTAQDIAGRLGGHSRVDLRSRPQSQCIVFPLLAEADCWRLMARVGPNMPSKIPRAGSRDRLPVSAMDAFVEITKHKAAMFNLHATESMTMGVRFQCYLLAHPRQALPK